MKRYIAFFMYLCCIAVMHAQDYTPTREVVETDSGIVVTYHFHGGIQQDDPLHGGAKFWKIPGFSLNSRIGQPAFPSRWDTFVIPEGVSPVVEVIDSAYTDTSFVMAPAYPFLSMSDTIGYTQDRVPDIHPYEGLFPTSIALKGRIRNYRGQNLLSVGIAPVQYDYIHATARVYSMIKYRIKFNMGLAIKRSNNNQTQSDAFLSNIILNKKDVETARLRKQAQITSATLDKYYYLIISTPRFKNSVDLFAEWKRKQGYNVIIKGTSENIYNDAFVWNDEHILSLINDIRSWAGDTLRYVLFVGDEQNIPGHQCQFGSYTFPSDYYYECLGNPVNNAPMLRIGRIPVSSNTEAEGVFRKIISYEQNPTSDDSFYHTAVSCAVFDAGLPLYSGHGMERGRAILSSENIIQYLENSISSPKSVKRIYLHTQTMSDCTPSTWTWNNSLYAQGGNIPSYLHDPNIWTGNYQNITDSINAGAFLFSYIGHGENYRWANNEVSPELVTLYSESYAASLNNEKKYPVLFSMSCHTGEYQHTTSCPAEFFLKKELSGAVAVIAPSSNTYMGFTEYMDEGFINAIWPIPGINSQHSLSTPVYELGDILAVSREWMGYMQTYNSITHLPDSLYHDDEDTYQFQCNIFHLFGDPSMQIYTERPSSFSNAFLTRSGNEITVTTNEPNTKVTFYDPNMQDETENVVSYVGSTITHQFDMDNTDALYISIRKHNFVPSTLEYIYDPYIQNESIYDTKKYLGEIIKVGRNVTNNKPQGDVHFGNGSDVILQGGSVTLDAGTHIELGAKVVINPGRVSF